MKDFGLELYEALDDVVLYVYDLYSKGEAEYPSEKSTKALLEGRRLLKVSSKALDKMDLNLAKDIVKEL